MIKANELRIGNYLQDMEYPFIVTVNELVYINDHKEHGYEQIPLTEEWLVKLGAKKTGIDKRTFCETYILKGVKLMLSNSGNFYYGKLYIGTVHKIQNLVFALTNEEI